MQKPGIPPARIPEITKISRPGMTFTLTLRSKHGQCRVATKVVRRERIAAGYSTDLLKREAQYFKSLRAGAVLWQLNNPVAGTIFQKQTWPSQLEPVASAAFRSKQP